MKKLIFGISLGMLALIVYSCKLEQVHASLAVNFDSDLNCYTAKFTTTAQGAYTWEFGDGTTSSEKNPVHRYDSPGSYEVSLTVESESGAGKVSKSLDITINGTTFHQGLDEHFGRKMFIRVDEGGYSILGAPSSSPGINSVLSFSDDGQYGEIIRQGSNFSNYISFYNTSAFKDQAVSNDKVNGTLTYTFADPLSGAFLASLQAPDTTFEGLESSLNGEVGVFVAGTYVSNLSNQEGAFLWTVGFGLPKTIFLDFLDPRELSLKPTPDGGAVLAILDPQQGIYVMKVDDAGQREWGRFISNSIIPVNSFNSPHIAVLALGNNDIVVSSSEARRRLSPGDSGGVGVVFRINETNDVWRKEVADFSHVREMILTKDQNIMICGGFNNSNNLIVPFLTKMNEAGEIQFTKEVLTVPEQNILEDILETENEGFLLLGNSNRNLSLFQVDCGGNL